MNDVRLSAELASLRDVEGVIGSFVLGESGTLLGRDLPNLFDDEVLGSVGLRVHRLLETFDAQGESGAHFSLRYAEHKLFLHRVDQAVIAVISGPQASSPAMTMALTLVGRRVSRTLATPAPSRSESLTRTLPSNAPTMPQVPRPVFGGTEPAPSESRSAPEAPPPAHALDTRYSMRLGAPEGRHAAPAPTARPRYFRGRRVE